ncbi:MAG: hypothetical protein C4324_03505 [Blastocatellia bacterium]
MTCPVCKRDLAPTLSICYACGAMVKDSVREELASRIERVSPPRIAAPRIDTPDTSATVAADGNRRRTPEKVGRVEQIETTELENKKTSPTLVGFQPRNASVPDWRLQLQNSVRQRKRIAAANPAHEENPNSVTTIGATALKPKPSEKLSSPETDPLLEQALRRIEESKKKFLIDPAGQKPPQTSARNFPFNLVSRNDAPDAGAPRATVNVPPKPRLIRQADLPKSGYDTNKLPPIDDVTLPPSVSAPSEATQQSIMPEPAKAEPNPSFSRPSETLKSAATTARPNNDERASFPSTESPMINPAEQSEQIELDVEFDDIPSVGTRLLAGMFDALAVAFVTGTILLPAVYFNSKLFSISGILAAAAIFGLVYFAYSAFFVWYYGRTLGMQIFGLEVIDAEANEYPTLHQAAVYSAASLFTLVSLGLGFIPVFLNQERRAAHDLIAGTVLVREI